MDDSTLQMLRNNAAQVYARINPANARAADVDDYLQQAVLVGIRAYQLASRRGQKISQQIIRQTMATEIYRSINREHPHEPIHGYSDCLGKNDSALDTAENKELSDIAYSILPLKYQLTMRAHFEGVNRHEIAASEGVTVHAIDKRIKKSLELIREHFASKGIL